MMRGVVHAADVGTRFNVQSGYARYLLSDPKVAQRRTVHNYQTDKVCSQS